METLLSEGDETQLWAQNCALEGPSGRIEGRMTITTERLIFEKRKKAAMVAGKDEWKTMVDLSIVDISEVLLQKTGLLSKRVKVSEADGQDYLFDFSEMKNPDAEIAIKNTIQMTEISKGNEKKEMRALIKGQ